MKATLKQIIEATGAVNILLGSKLPVKASYSVSKLATACSHEMEHYNKRREKLFEDAGCVLVITGKNDDGTDKKEYQHPEDVNAVEAVVKQVEEMQGAEVEINALALDLEQFGNADLQGAAFFGLDWAMKQ